MPVAAAEGDLSAAIREPRLKRFYDYWQMARRGRRFPARCDIDPLDFPYMLGNVMLVDVLRDPLRFRIRLHATNVVDRAGLDLTGKLIDEMPAERRKAAEAHYRQVLAQRAPLALCYEHHPIDERMWNCEVLVLPLSTDGTTIDMLMSAFVWNSEA